MRISLLIRSGSISALLQDCGMLLSMILAEGGPILRILVPILLGVAIPGLLFLSIRSRLRQRIIDNIPTSKTEGVFIGLVELKGTAEVEVPLTSYLAHSPCVFYKFQVEEHWRRVETETYTDSDGKTKTRTVVKTGWTTVASGKDMKTFYLQDDTGVIQIVPEGAELEGDRVFSRSCGRGDPLYYDKGPAGAIANSTHERRFTEHAIVLHSQLYVMGRSRERQDVVAAEIAHDPESPMFLISTKSEEQISSRYGCYFWGGAIGGLLATIGETWILSSLSNHDGEFPLQLAFLFGGLYFLIWFVAWAVMVFNNMMTLRNRVRQAWSNIDVQLKRRHDLIPQLVEIVKGYSDHESTVHEQLAHLRNQTQASAPGEGGVDPQACAQSLRALQESYPDLQAHTLFRQLQDGLVNTEQKIALARGYFNSIATNYNTRVEQFPDALFAKAGGLKLQPLMEIGHFERAVVQVNFASGSL